MLGRDGNRAGRRVRLVEHRLRLERDIERLGRKWLDTATIVLEHIEFRGDRDESIVGVINGLRDASVLPRIDRNRLILLGCVGVRIGELRDEDKRGLQNLVVLIQLLLGLILRDIRNTHHELTRCKLRGGLDGNHTIGTNTGTRGCRVDVVVTLLRLCK